MRLIDPEVRECKALVIDGNSTSRSALMNMLRDIGVGHISQTGACAPGRHRFAAL
jgi:acetolactate synthase small subunit